MPDLIATVRAQISQYEAAFRQMQQTATTSAAAVTTAYRQAGQQLDAALQHAARTAGTASEQVAAAYKALGVRSTEEIVQAQVKIRAAYAQIAASGTASTEDLNRAHASMERQLRALTQEALPAAGGKFRQFAERVQEAGVAQGLLGTALSLLTSPVAAAGVAFGALMLGINRATDAAVRNMQEVKQMVAVSGLSAEAADNLGDTFAMLGESTGAAATAMFRMSNEIESGGAGLRKLGVELRDAGGELKTEGDLFLEVRDKISGLGTAGERSAALIDIFGRAGRALAPVFALSREQFAAFMKEAGAISPWSDEAQKKTYEYVVASNKLALTWQGLKETAGLTVIPILTTILGLLTSLIARNQEAEDSTKTLAEEMEDAWTRGALGFISAEKQKQQASEETVRMRMNALRAEHELTETVERLTADQLKARELQMQGELAAVTRALDLQQAHREQAAAVGRLTETEVLQGTLRDLDTRQAAIIKAYVQELLLLQQKEDQSGTLTRAATEKFQQNLAEIEKSRIQTNTRLLQEERKLTEWVHGEYLKQAERVVETEEKRVELEREVNLELTKLTASETETVIAAENEKARVTVEKIYQALGETEKASTLSLKVLKIRDLKIAASEQERVNKSLDILHEWGKEVETIYQGEAVAVEETYQKQRGIVETYFAVIIDAAQRAGEDTLGLEKKKQETIEKLEQTRTTKHQQALQARLEQEGRALAQTRRLLESATAQELFRHEAKIDQEERDRKRLVQAYAKTNAEILAGVDRTNLMELEKSAATVNEIVELRDREVKALQTVNEADKRLRDQQLERTAQVSRASGNFVDYFLARFQQAAGVTTTFWDSLGRLASETAQAMSRSLSDFFFNVFTGQITSAQDLFKGFLNSLLRAVSDFLATQTVNLFLNFLAGGGGGGFLGFGGGGGGGQISPAAISQLASAGIITAAQAQALQTVNQLPPPGLASPGQTLLGSASLAAAFPGIANIGANYAAGGLSGVVLGLPPIVSIEGGGMVQGTAGLIGSSGALTTMGGVMGALGTAYSLYSGISALMSGQTVQGASTLGGTAVGAGIGFALGGPIGALVGAGIGGGAGGILGSIFGGLFGGDDDYKKTRDAEYMARVQAESSGFASAIASTQSLQDLWNLILSYQSGYVGGTSSRAIGINVRVPRDLLTSPGISWATSSPYTLQRALGPIIAGSAYAPQDSSGTILIGPGRANPLYPVITNPNLFFDLIRAGNLQSMNVLGGGPFDLAFNTQVLIDQIQRLSSGAGPLLISASTGGGLTAGSSQPVSSATAPPIEYQPPIDWSQIGGYSWTTSYAQHGGFVPGVGEGDRTHMMLEPGELIVPRPFAQQFPLLAEEFLRAGSSRRLALNVTFNVGAGADLSPAQARRFARQLRDEIRRLDERTYATPGVARG